MCEQELNIYLLYDKLINQYLSSISHTILYLARKKSKSIYTISIYFQPENIRSLCQAVLKVVYDLGLVDTDVHRESINICTKYPLLLNKFAKCEYFVEKRKTDLVCMVSRVESQFTISLIYLKLGIAGCLLQDVLKACFKSITGASIRKSKWLNSKTDFIEKGKQPYSLARN